MSEFIQIENHAFKIFISFNRLDNLIPYFFVSSQYHRLTGQQTFNVEGRLQFHIKSFSFM